MKSQIWEELLNNKDLITEKGTHFMRPSFVQDYKFKDTLNVGDKIYCLYEISEEFVVKKLLHDCVEAIDSNEKIRSLHYDSIFTKKLIFDVLKIKIVDTKTKKNNANCTLQEGNYFIGYFKAKKDKENSGFFLIDSRCDKSEKKKFMNITDLKSHFKIDRVSKPKFPISDFQKYNEKLKKIWKFDVTK